MGTTHKVYPLSLQERAATGFTHVAKIKYDTATEELDDTDEAWALFPLAAGDVVGERCLMETKTLWTGLTTANGIVMVSADVTPTTQVSAVVASTSVLAAAYVTPVNTIIDYVASAAHSLCFVLDPGTNTQAVAVDSLTGEVWVWFQVFAKADRDRVTG